MKTTYKSFLSSALVAGLIIGSGGSIATEGYWFDAEGGPIVDAENYCVRTKEWSPGGYTPACDPKPVEVAVVEEVVETVPLVEAVEMQMDTLFDFDKYEVKPEGVAAIGELAGQIGGMDSVQSIRVDGHTDSTGPEEYNMGLSERRADAVKDQLVSDGVDSSLVETVGHGENDPVADNATREGRAQNRRAVVTVVGEQAVQ